MKKSTIALCSILKNERHNLQRFLDSFAPYVDEVHMCDTGSSDGSVEFLEEFVKTGYKGTPLFLHHFKWVDDFAAARNHSMSFAKTDYLFWADLDDALEKPESFMKWRESAMELADYWLATYHYGFDNAGNPACSFARERVFKRDRGFQFNYFIHEGVVPKSPYYENVKINYAATWAIAHQRTARDMEQDRSRNLRILEKNKDKLDLRLRYYYGKELFDSGQFVEAIHYLMDSASDTKAEHHDRLLALQYACFAYTACNQFEKAISVAHQGLQLDPNRAEFWVCIGDCYTKTGRHTHAIPAYSAAKECLYKNPQTGMVNSMIFSSSACYQEYPRMQLARIYLNIGMIKEALVLAKESAVYPNEEAKKLCEEVTRISEITTPKSADQLEKTDDIIISCPPGSQLYEWDAEIAKTRGIGGSETAAVQMAYWLHKLSGKPVKVFNARKDTLVSDGVEYIPNDRLGEYAAKKLPLVHIAWRHTIPVTKAKTLTWSHDLQTPGVENSSAYDKVLCLSPFHKDYCMAMQGVPEDKIWVTRNGLDPKRFSKRDETQKIPAKVIFSSSPDRGLKEAMLIMDKVVDEIPNAELHIFYGFDNMRKMGMGAQADFYEAEMKKRPYVKYHGNVQQDILAQHFMEAEVWLYPADFIETFAITAIEAMAAKCYPVATNIGALQNTVGQFAKLGMADLLDERADTVLHQNLYADRVIWAIKEKKWQKINYPLEKLSWESVAKEWIEHFEL